MQPKSQFSSGYSAHKASTPGAQHLNLTRSTTLLSPCSLRVSSAHAIQPIRLQCPGASAAQFEELNSSTQAPNSDHADKKSIQIKQNSAKSTSRGEKSEMKNEYSLRKRLQISWVPSPEKKKKQKTSKQRYKREIRHQRKEQRAKKGSGPQREYLVLQNGLRRRSLPPPRR